MAAICKGREMEKEELVSGVHILHVRTFVYYMPPRFICPSSSHRSSVKEKLPIIYGTGGNCMGI